MNIRLFLRYDGTAYYGWQIQNRDGQESDLRTVQGTLKSALRTLLCDDTIEPVGCSRTDAGVHADMYCASFHTATEAIPADRICYALRPFLPEDIVVYRSEQVPEDFHARFDTVSKTYRYLFYASPFPYPCMNGKAWHIKLTETQKTPDLAAMKQAASGFVGTHDFAAFCAAGGSSKTTTRTIFRTDVEVGTVPGSDGTPLYTFYIEGDGFLYNMVRIAAGTVLHAGLGKIIPRSIPVIIASKDRKKAGITAPACGLYLHNVSYKPF